MANFDKLQVLNKLAERPIVPVFYNSDVETSCAVLKACYDGGIRLFEFTNRGDFAHEVFRGVIEFALKNCPEMSVGVGSIVEPSTAAMYIQMGACFVVGPMFNPEVAKLCNRRGIPYIPGCGTVSEISQAQEAGCEVCKVFPGDVLGPKFVKGILGPMPWSRLMVTGGVEPSIENLKSWFDAGAFCVGMGSKLFPKETLKNKDWDQITVTCHTLLDSFISL